VKLYYNTASNIGGAIRTFFDYSLLNVNEKSPAIFYRNQDESSSISMSRPSYFVLSCYDYNTDPGKTPTDGLKTNHAVLFDDFRLLFS